MKKILLLLFVVLYAYNSRAQYGEYINDQYKGTYTVNGNLTVEKSSSANSAKGKPTKVYLSYNVGRTEILDSTVLANGKFQFKGTLEGPTKANISLYYKHSSSELESMPELKAYSFDFFLTKGSVNISSNTDLSGAKVVGSPLNNEFFNYKSLIASADTNIRKFRELFQNATREQRDDPAYRKKISKIYMKGDIERDSLKKLYIKTNPRSIFSLVAMAEILDGLSLNRYGTTAQYGEISTLYNQIPLELRTTVFGKRLTEQLGLQSKISIGAIAPNFTANDVKNQKISLSDYKGKYLLLDFWASWCNPCRMENPNLMKVYKALKDKNFTILGMTLDESDDKWKKAVTEDSLPWKQATTRKASMNIVKMYNITGIPANLLLDPAGRIILKDLRGADLESKLIEAIGK